MKKKNAYYMYTEKLLYIFLLSEVNIIRCLHASQINRAGEKHALPAFITGLVNTKTTSPKTDASINL